MEIKITSKLTRSAQQRLNRGASDYPVYAGSYIHTGRNRYSAVVEGYDHDAARHMMVVAGTTFDYEIV